MNILIVTSNYFPEPLGIGLYSYDLATLLTQQGHRVTVLTTIPYYPWWKTPQEYEIFACKKATLDGVDVYRTSLKLGKTQSTIGRIAFELRLWLGLRRVFKLITNRKFDKIISIIPSLGAGMVARMASKSNSVPHYLIIQDITTNGVSESGMSSGSILRHSIMLIEGRIIRSASSVAVISQNMIQSIKKISDSPTEIVYLPNYETGVDFLSEHLDRSHFEIPLDKFVVMHAGSIAKKQNLEILVEAARILQGKEIIFYLFGHGNALDEVSKLSQNLSNFYIKPSVPKDEFKSLLKMADLLIVNERATQVSMALPSKLISYFSSEVPVLAAVPENGATYQAVEGLAFWTEAGNPHALAEAIQAIAALPAERRANAKAARNYYENNLTGPAGRQRYLNWLFES